MKAIKAIAIFIRRYIQTPEEWLERYYTAKRFKIAHALVLHKIQRHGETQARLAQLDTYAKLHDVNRFFWQEPLYKAEAIYRRDK